MKKVSLLTVFMILIPMYIIGSQEQKNDLVQNDKKSVTITVAPEIDVLVAKWVEGFENAHPELKVTISSAGSLPPDNVIHFVTSTPVIQGEPASAWRMVVGRDVIIAVVNESNPMINDIAGKGISAGKFRALLQADEPYTWGMMLDNSGTAPVNAWILENKNVLSALSEFTGLSQPVIRGSLASSPEQVMAELNKDRGAVAFCRLTDITEPGRQEFVNGIRIVPIDVNSNGISDYFEQFYSDYHSFNRGVYIGKYPKPLFNNIFAVSANKPAETAETALLSYILMDGQAQLEINGYTALAEGEGRIKRGSLYTDNTLVTEASAGAKPFRSVVWLLALASVITMLAFIMYRLTRSNVLPDTPNENAHKEGFNEKSLVIPGGILFDKSHTWAFMEKDGYVRIGIDDFLQHITGSITRVRMKSPGNIIRKGEHIFSLVQKGKQIDICSPVTGTIITINDDLNTVSAAINSSPYSEGWVYTIKPDNWLKESRLMIMASSYIEWIRDEFNRVKDFITALPGVNEVRLSHIVLQDGGELRDGLLEEFGPDVWEEFQMKFIDSGR